MKYAELLKKYIKNSRYTLDEISRLLLEKGLSASREHLSRLQNGKVPPATDEINRAISDITGGDPDTLIWYAYVDRAPEGFKDILYAVGDEIIPIGKKVNDKFPGFLEGKYYRSYLEQQPEYLEFQEALKRGLVNASKGPGGFSFTLEGKAAENFNRKIQEEYVKETESLYSSEDFVNIKETLKVPVLGNIAAGAPIFAEEHILDYSNIINPSNYKEGDLFMLIVKGDSMNGSRIYEGDKVLVKVQPEVENGQIAVVNVNGDDATLKKVKKYEDGSVWLVSTNEKYAPIPLHSDRARIIGKVIQVVFEP